MYTTRNFKTKKAVREAVQAWLNYSARCAELGVEPYSANNPAMTGESAQPVRVYAPRLGEPATQGREFVEGPHFPEPHKWYAQVTVKDGIVIAVK